MHNEVEMSPLSKTWILDLDGTLVVHNGYKEFGEDVFLDGAKEFLQNIPDEDMIIFLTSRKLEFKERTEAFLRKYSIRWNHIIYEVPYGERILINDRKPSGLDMAHAFSISRNHFQLPFITINENL